jgi:hypothetical protein
MGLTHEQAVEFGRRGGTASAKRWSGESTLVDRFWSKVDRRSEDECWNWTAAVTTGGYGEILDRTIDNGGLFQGKQFAAHRLSYELAYGRIADGLVIDHECGNRKCVNPQHLVATSIHHNAIRSQLGKTKQRRGSAAPR